MENPSYLLLMLIFIVLDLDSENYSPTIEEVDISEETFSDVFKNQAVSAIQHTDIL